MGTKTAVSIEFEAPVMEVGTTTIVRLPQAASRRLPSRGQVAVSGTMNGHDFSTVIEPDGLRGHWIRVTSRLRKAAGLATGGTATVAVTVVDEWPEPEVPADLAGALEAAPRAVQEAWDDITPMARWEWVRWVNATANPATRQRRIEVSVSKLDNGKRRPCCFDLASCTDPSVAKSGKLVESA